MTVNNYCVRSSRHCSNSSRQRQRCWWGKTRRTTRTAHATKKSWRFLYLRANGRAVQRLPPAQVPRPQQASAHSEQLRTDQLKAKLVCLTCGLQATHLLAVSSN